MSLLPGLETKTLEEEIAHLEESGLTLLSRGQRVFALLELLLSKLDYHPAHIKTQKERLANSFSGHSVDTDKLSDIQERLKEELFFFDLKFTGGKKGSKANRDLALETIISHLESLEGEIEQLERKRHHKHRQTPAGQIEAQIEADNKARCCQDILRDLPRLNDVDQISQLKLEPRHLELAGVYGVDLTREAILSEWKKMLEKTLLEKNFAGHQSKINNFQKYKPFTENFSNYNQNFEQVKDWAAALKGLQDKTVLTLADIIANNEDVKQKFHHYGITGARLNPETKRLLTRYDDLSEAQVYDSPAALAQEYLDQMLAAIIGSGDENALNTFNNLFNFRYFPDSECPGANVFGEKYNREDFTFFNRADYDPEFLLRFGANLGKLVATLRSEIKAAGAQIDPKTFVAHFGRDNYDLIKNLPKLSQPEAKIANFPQEYVEPFGALSQKYYEDEAVFNRFMAWNKQAIEKLERLLEARFLELELVQKQQNNPGVWETLNDKIKLADYLKFLEKNRDYHSRRPIGININDADQIELLDAHHRQLEANLKAEYETIAQQYKEYLKAEMAALITAIRETEEKLFNKKETLAILHDRLGTCQILSSHSLSDRIHNRISSTNFEFFKESTLTTNELEQINSFVSRGQSNLAAQAEARAKYESHEKDLNRHPDKLEARFLSEYPNLAEDVTVYENLINNLKLVNLSLSSLLKEKHSHLIKDFSAKNQTYQKLVNDYNRKYHREGGEPLRSAIDLQVNLADYL